MKKTHLISALVLICLLFAVVFYFYKVSGNRSKIPLGNKSNSNQNSFLNSNSSLPGEVSQNQNSNENANGNENLNGNENQNSQSQEVTGKDCNEDCKRFKNDNGRFRYCQEVCGDIPVTSKNSEEECNSLTGLEKDYCLRDLAVSQKTVSLCNKITDAKLKSTCKNRVAEELLN